LMLAASRLELLRSTLHSLVSLPLRGVLITANDGAVSHKSIRKLALF